MENTTIKRFYTIPEVMKATTLGRTSVYHFINKGLLTAKKMGSKSVITAESLEAFISSLPAKTKVGGSNDE